MHVPAESILGALCSHGWIIPRSATLKHLIKDDKVLMGHILGLCIAVQRYFVFQYFDQRKIVQLGLDLS